MNPQIHRNRLESNFEAYDRTVKAIRAVKESLLCLNIESESRKATEEGVKKLKEALQFLADAEIALRKEGDSM